MATLSELAAQDVGAPQQVVQTSLSEQALADHAAANAAPDPFGRSQAELADNAAQRSRIGDLAYGGTIGLANLVEAPAQAMLHGANWLYDKLGASNSPRGPAGKLLQNISNDFDNHLADQEATYQRNTPNSGAAGIGRLVAGVAPFVATGGSSAAPQSVGAIRTAVQMLRSGAGAAGKGVLYGVSQPVSNVTQTSDGGNDYADKKINQAELGAAFGAAGRAVGGIAGKAINPNISPEVRGLIDQGITPTAGQILGGGWAATENKATSIPIVGDMIKNAQRRAVDDFNTATYNRALKPLGTNAAAINATPGREGVEAVRTTLGNAYDSLLPKLQFKVDPQFATDFSNLNDLARNLPPTQAAQFAKIIQNTFVSKLGPQGTMDGIALKGVESDLGKLARGYGNDTLFDNRQLGDAIRQAQDNIRSNLTRNNPQYAEDLKNINEGYANFARIRQAAASTGAPNGVFTPAQLQSAVKNQDKSVGKGNFATGKALLQDLSEPGKDVLSTYPDSGTAGRNMVGALTAGSGPVIAGALTHPVGTALAGAGTIGATALGSAPYSKMGQSLAATLLAGGNPKIRAAIANGVSDASPYAGLAITPALINYLKQRSN